MSILLLDSSPKCSGTIRGSRRNSLGRTRFFHSQSVWMIVACESIVLCLYSHMLLFEHARVFFPRFLESRKYEIQVVAHVGRKSAVALSGIMEASYSHFFITIDFDCCTTRKRRARKIHPDKTPIASGVEESNSPRRALLLLLSDSPGGRFSGKKNTHVNK